MFCMYVSIVMLCMHVMYLCMYVRMYVRMCVCNVCVYVCDVCACDVCMHAPMYVMYAMYGRNVCMNVCM